VLRGISASGQQRAKGRRDEKGLHERGRHRFLAPLFKLFSLLLESRPTSLSESILPFSAPISSF